MPRKFRIVSAKPKGATNHCNSKFKVFQWGRKEKDGKVDWWEIGWKSINEISEYLAAGDEVRTGQYKAGKITDGAPVELELRITKNSADFKISDMPDV
ncbi:hypothetical protein [Sphingomonas sp. UYP23]